MLGIKNIVFDLGNVILNIDTKLSEKEFAKHGLYKFEDLYSLASQSKIFDRLELGQISPSTFYQEFRELTKTDLSDSVIQSCWNSLIKDFPLARIELLEKLKPKFRTFILSNTNKIHYQHYTKMLQEKYNYPGLESLVEKAYFSHEIKMKKPESEIFDFIAADSGLIPMETLFIDDNYDNIEEAKRLNFQTILIKNISLENLDIWKNIEL